jgi:hypothetical protein
MVRLVDGRITRRDGHRKIDELFQDSTAYYQRQTLYEINLQQEIIKAVEARQ